MNNSRPRESLKKSRAMLLLKNLRNGTVPFSRYEVVLRYIRLYLKDGEDIGTSEEELKVFRIKGCKIAAESWLDLLRRGSSKNPERCILYLRNNMKRGELTLENIGTSEEELQSFVTKQ